MQALTSDDYFFESANNISFFFEEGAHDAEGKLKQEKALSINKIGHALHDVDPVFRKWTRSHKLTQLLLDLGLIKPLPVQSMYIFKVTAASKDCFKTWALYILYVNAGHQIYFRKMLALCEAFGIAVSDGNHSFAQCVPALSKFALTAVCHAATSNWRQICSASGMSGFPLIFDALA